MGHLTVSMRQKTENQKWRLNTYFYDVASTMECLYKQSQENHRNANMIFVSSLLNFDLELVRGRGVR